MDWLVWSWDLLSRVLAGAGFAAPPEFVVGCYLLLGFGGLIPVELSSRRYYHYPSGLVGVAAFFIMGPRVLWLPVVATCIWSVLFQVFTRMGVRSPALKRPSLQPEALPVATAIGAVCIFAGDLARRAIGAGAYPLDISGARGALHFVLLSAIMLAVGLPLLEAYFWWYRKRRPPPPIGDIEAKLGMLYRDHVLIALLVVMGGPVAYASIVAYDPQVPWLSLAWMSVGLFLAGTFSILNERKNRIVRLVRELELSRRLITVGKVAARFAHQTRHELGLIGMSLHQIERHTRELPEQEREQVQAELEKLERIQNELRRLMSDALGGGEELADEAGKPAPPDRAVPVQETPGVIELLEREILHVRPRAQARGISVLLELRGNEEITRRAQNGEKLGHAFFNVIDNAVAAAGSKVSVRVERNGENATLVRILDDGPGIDPEIFGRVTLPFFSTKEDGTGMGLAIAFAVAQEEAGSLKLRNRREGGLEVTFELPD
ncbi:MAG: HAMP domain-containing histidine kinase [Chrysiogenetes bacterium]|nr:HAMP domain-containing histidine kinase [Chrysiogenetes bacterium]